MKSVLALLGLVLGPLWLFQLRANIVAVLGAWPYVPDLLALGVVFASCRLNPREAVGFGMVSGLLMDVCTGHRFGALALQNAILVSVFIPLRKLFFVESGAALFALVFGFCASQKITEGLIWARGDWAFWLPRLLAVSFSTAVTALLVRPGFEFFFQSSSEERETSPRRRR